MPKPTRYPAIYFVLLVLCCTKIFGQGIPEDYFVCDSIFGSENYTDACEPCLIAWNSMSGSDSLKIEAGIRAGYSLRANGRNAESWNVYQDLVKCCLDPKHPDDNYLFVCSEFVEIAYSMNDATKIIETSNETVRVIKELYGDDEKLVDYYYTLGEEYLTSGDYAAAQKSYLNAAEIYMKYHDHYDLRYARIIVELSSAYISVGMYDVANKTNYDALKIIETSDESDAALLADAYQLLVWGYNGLGNFDSALAYTNKVIEISYELPLFQRATALTTSALYIINFDIAHGTQIAFENRFDKILDIVTTIYDSIKPEAVFINNVLVAYGNYYVTLGKFDSTIYYYEKSTALVAEAYGKNNIIYLNSITTLGSYYEMNNQLAEAASVYDSLMSDSRKFLRSNFIFLSAEQQESILQNFYRNRDIVYSFYHSHPDQPGMPEMYFDNEILLKGILLENITSMRNSIYDRGDNVALSLFNQWVDMKKQLAVIYLNNQPDVSNLQSQVTNIELQLAKNKILNPDEKIISLKDIQNKLNKGEAAVEYLSFNYNFTEDEYYAIVITKNENSLIWLGDQYRFDSLFAKRTDETTASYIKRIYSVADPEFPEDSTYYSGNKIYDLVWAPLEKYLKGSKKIYIAPAGILHQVSFQAIPVEKEIRLMNLYDITMVSSTKEILSQNHKREYDSFLLAGGVSYNTDNSSGYAGPVMPLIVWPQLPGTYSEVQIIDSLLTGNGMNSISLTQNNANENYFKTDSIADYDVIHLATHGYFYGSNAGDNSSTGIKYKNSTNPLLRSGLILAGGNYSWVNNLNSSNDNDGILTAYEISNLNLSSTGLVVLSACETGLGDIKGSEGVYGLQRAFKMAGVDEVVMSLWSVPDKYTIELMELFYSFLLDGDTASEALKKAQLTMQKKTGVYNWAAFILIE